ncbi:SAM-dependent methyltransferase, partial [Streptomyces sp. NPDC058964]
GGGGAVGSPTPALDVEWIGEAADRADRFFGGDIGAEKQRAARPDLADPSGRLRFTRREVRWSRRVPLATHLANISSHSAFLVTTEERRTAFLDEERAHLLKVFPDGVVEETYDVLLLVATHT